MFRSAANLPSILLYTYALLPEIQLFCAEQNLIRHAEFLGHQPEAESGTRMSTRGKPSKDSQRLPSPSLNGSVLSPFCTARVRGPSHIKVQGMFCTFCEVPRSQKQ
jgi:hypothetical protein